ncbi:MAG: hypothetical protein KIS66_16535 [Fimbriimonadaceae bacterium]|nr:hypothetical protein [Fimbriimonadaceae bacterium]
MRLAPVALLAVALGALVGCGPKDPLDGKWTADTFPGQTAQMGDTKVTATFSGGKTFSLVVDSNLPQNMGSIQATIDGTYTFTKDQLKMTATSAKLDDSKLKLPKEMQALAKQQMKDADKNLIKQINDAPAGTIKLEGGDKFSWTVNGQATEFKRAK